MAAYAYFIAELAKLSHAQLLALNAEHLAQTQDVSRALVGEQIPLADLRPEYDGAPIFQRRIDWLVEHGWNAVRRSRGDGDCFYRCAFSFQFAFSSSTAHPPGKPSPSHMLSESSMRLTSPSLLPRRCRPCPQGWRCCSRLGSSLWSYVSFVAPPRNELIHFCEVRRFLRDIHRDYNAHRHP